MPETPTVRSVALTDDLHYRLLKRLAERPDASQRQLSDALGVSLGKINYCVRSLLDEGWIKATNFKNNKNKLAYVYLLTPSGIDAKARITVRFLKRRMAEYEALNLHWSARVRTTRTRADLLDAAVAVGPDLPTD